MSILPDDPRDPSADAESSAQRGDPTRIIAGDDPGPMPGMSAAPPAGESPSLLSAIAPPLIEGYEVTRLISRGGQGAVYQAVQNSTRRKVAIKVLLETWCDSAPARRRFEREVELVAHLKHPNIIAVFDSGMTADGRLFYVMDYVRGEPITRFARDRKLDLRAALELFAAVCDAVSHAHQKGVIHRDLKPSNILIDADGQAHVLDFGLAKAITERVEPLTTLSGQVLGTPAYMSPEQAGGKLDEIDTRSDVYCLGIILFEILTGRFPYPVSGTLVETARHIEQTSPAAPSAAWDPAAGIRCRASRLAARCPLDSEVETIVLKALAKERQRRYQSAGELADDIRRYLQGLPIQARRDSAMYMLKKTLSRYRAATSFAALFVILLAASAIVFFIQRQEARQARREALTERDRANAASTEARVQQRLAEQRLADGQLSSGDSILAPGRGYESRLRYLRAWDIEHNRGESVMPGVSAMLASYLADPPPLMGGDGPRPGIGGFDGHTAGVMDVACLPDGIRALTAGQDKTIRLWDLRTGREIRQYIGHRDSVRALAVLPGGERFISAGSDETLRLWEVHTGRDAGVFRGHVKPVTDVAVTPDGRTAVSCGHDGTVRVWDIASQKQLKQFDSPGEKIPSISLSQDGALVMATCPATLRARIWDLRTYEELKEIPSIYAARFMPDSRFVIGVRMDLSNSLALYDRNLGSEIRQFAGHADFVGAVRVAAPGRLAISCSTDRTIKVWDIGSGRLVRTLGGHMAPVMGADACPGSPMCVSAGFDGVARLWDLSQASSDVPAFTGQELLCSSVAISPDGRTALSGSSDGAVRLWDLATRRVLWRTSAGSSQVEAVAFSPDGRLAAWGCLDGRAGAGEIGKTESVRTFPAERSRLRGVAFMPDGRRLLTTSDSTLPRIWEISTGREAGRMEGPPAATLALAVSHEHGVAVAGCADQTIRLFGLADSKPRWSIQTPGKAEFSAIALSSDGRLVAAGDVAGNIRVVDAAAQKSVGHVQKRMGTITGIGFLDGGRVIAAGGTDHTLRLLDPGDGHEIRSLAGHAQALSALAVAPGGMSLITASNDRAMRWWDLSRPQRYWEFESELPNAREALQRNEKDAEALAAFGRWYMFRDVWNWAGDLLEQSRAAGGKVRALDLARCHWQTGRLDKAKSEFTLARDHNEAPADYLDLCLRAVQSEIAAGR